MDPATDFHEQAPDTWPTGKVIAGTWRIERRIGHGSFGAAYLVVHQLLPNRRAVIKRLDERHSHDRKFVQSFIDEASMMDALADCPQVVQPWDLNRSEDRFVYICMEFMPGGSLAALLDHQPDKCLDPGTALEITRQILQALEHAHAARILHLDIKPDNILLKSATPPYGAKLADFGIAYRIAEAAADGQLQQQTTQFRGFGSAGYIPLEQAMGRRRDLDGRADLYALGMTLYRMLTGRFAFLFDSPTEWPILIKGAEPPPPSKFRPELAKIHGLDAFVLKLTARDRESRFASAAEALLALASVGARPKGVPPTEKLNLDPTSKPPSRRTAIIGGALAAMPIILGGGGYWLGYTAAGKPGAASEDQSGAEQTAEAAVVGFLAKQDVASAREEVRKFKSRFPNSKAVQRMEDEIAHRPTGQ